MTSSVLINIKSVFKQQKKFSTSSNKHVTGFKKKQNYLIVGINR